MTRCASQRLAFHRGLVPQVLCSAGLLLSLCEPALAEPDAGSSPVSGTAIVASAFDDQPLPPLQLSGAAGFGGSGAGVTARRGLALKLPTLSIVEMPAEHWMSGSAPRKMHHALSISAETPQRWLRQAGVEATDCATRIRMPSRWRTEADGSRSFSFGAHLNLACRF